MTTPNDLLNIFQYTKKAVDDIEKNTMNTIADALEKMNKWHTAPNFSIDSLGPHPFRIRLSSTDGGKIYSVTIDYITQKDAWFVVSYLSFSHHRTTELFLEKIEGATICENQAELDALYDEKSQMYSRYLADRDITIPHDR